MKNEILKDWKYFCTDHIVTDNYYVWVSTQYDTFHFKVKYVRRNGFTLIESVDFDRKQTSPFGNLFLDWFSHRIDFNTRYDEPHWYRRIRFNRKKKIVTWAITNVDLAYSQFKKEMVDKTINE